MEITRLCCSNITLTGFDAPSTEVTIVLLPGPLELRHSPSLETSMKGTYGHHLSPDASEPMMGRDDRLQATESSHWLVR